MRNRQWVFGIIPIVIALTGAGIWIQDGAPLKSGKTSRQEVVDAYIQALRTEDGEALKRLNHPDYDAQEIQQRMEQFGGSDLKLGSSTLLDIMGTHSAAILQFQKGNQLLDDRIDLERKGSKWHGGRWFLVLGRFKHPVSNPASPAVR